jgi:hypothetical protein
MLWGCGKDYTAAASLLAKVQKQLKSCYMALQNLHLLDAQFPLPSHYLKEAGHYPPVRVLN